MNQTDKLTLINRTLNDVVQQQIDEIAAKLKAAQAQTDQLERQYGKPRRAS